jgi:hypothetical protein
MRGSASEHLRQGVREANRARSTRPSQRLWIRSGAATWRPLGSASVASCLTAPVDSLSRCDCPPCCPPVVRRWSSQCLSIRSAAATPGAGTGGLPTVAGTTQYLEIRSAVATVVHAPGLAMPPLPRSACRFAQALRLGYGVLPCRPANNLHRLWICLGAATKSPGFSPGASSLLPIYFQFSANSLPIRSAVATANPDPSNRVRPQPLDHHGSDCNPCDKSASKSGKTTRTNIAGV